MSDAAQRAKEAAWDTHNHDLLRMEAKSRSRWALQSPSGNVIGMGREKPRLTKEDRREFWRVIRLGR